MKPKHFLKALPFLLPFLMVVNLAHSQCGAGYSEAKVN